MAEPIFDIVFAGQLSDLADQDQVKQRIGHMFKLDSAGVERLFSGHRVFLKRGVDRTTANRFYDLFFQAGAIVELVALGGGPDDLITFDDSDEDSPSAAVEQSPQPHQSLPRAQSSAPAPKQKDVPPAPTPAPNGELSLAPTGSTLEELSNLGPEQHPDISQLSLVDGHDWSLEDCAPPPLAQQIADIDSLSLEPMPDRNSENQDAP